MICYKICTKEMSRGIRLGKTITIHMNLYDFVIKYIPEGYISHAVVLQGER